MKEIEGNAKNLSNLLGNAKFSIDYYQREYQWKKEQVNELLNDLTEKFLDSHDEENPIVAVATYGRYFLGSIIISDRGKQKFIIDGQQRLTSLTLLLIYIYNQLKDDSQKGQLAQLIFSRKFGRLSFNLDVEERNDCMSALFEGQDFDEKDHPPSVANIVHRYHDIQDTFQNNFPSELMGETLGDKTLSFFADWLMENVYLVEITAFSDADAYTIFETMNDRGLSLTPTDMLKGYLLANIDGSQRKDANKLWCKQIAAIQKLGENEESMAIKSWLRSQHAETIRERKKKSSPEDFDRIGTEFHRWVREKEGRLGLQASLDFYRFIEEDFQFYSKWYETIKKATTELQFARKEGIDAIYYNAQNNFTLQYPALLAPLCQSDSTEECFRKLRVVSNYIDILIAQRIWNYKTVSYAAMQYNMFSTTLLIRNKPPDELAKILFKRLQDEGISFESDEPFRLHGQNRKRIHWILARMTDFIETQSGRPSRYDEYTRSSNDYEIEHIWANHYERHQDEFGHPADFGGYRNRIGGLLLLPKAFNTSYSDKPYAKKYEHYFSQNLLSQSLHERAYEHNPGFIRFNKSFEKEMRLCFKPHIEFKREDLDARQALYQALAEKIWDAKNIQLMAES